MVNAQNVLHQPSHMALLIGPAGHCPVSSPVRRSIQKLFFFLSSDEAFKKLCASLRRRDISRAFKSGESVGYCCFLIICGQFEQALLSITSHAGCVLHRAPCISLNLPLPTVSSRLQSSVKFWSRN